MTEEQKAEVKQHNQEERQDAATAPMVDPDAASRAYLNGNRRGATVPTVAQQ